MTMHSIHSFTNARSESLSSISLRMSHTQTADDRLKLEWERASKDGKASEGGVDDYDAVASLATASQPSA